jgi:hypothetical protein
MGLLDALKLPPAPPATARTAASPATSRAPAAATVNGRTANQDPATLEKVRTQLPAVRAQLDKAWVEALDVAKRIEDAPRRKAFAETLKAVDAKRRQAGKAEGDPATQIVLMGKALIELGKARESAETRGGPAPRQAAERSRAEADRHYRAAYDAHDRLAAEQEALKTQIAAERGSARKKELLEKKAELDDKVDAAEHRRKQAQETLETVDDPLADDAARKRAVARSGRRVDVAESTTVDRHVRENLGPGEKKTTTTTSRVDQGVARIDKTVDTRTVDADGLTVARTIESERTTKGGTLKQGERAQANLSAKGLALERKKTSEFEGGDGRKLSVEKTTSLEVGPGGARGSGTRTVERRDGSSTSTTVSGGVERGEGKAVVAVDASRTTTDASGTATTVSGGARQGIVAGKDGYGATAERSGGIARSRKNGLQTDAKLTFGSVVTCRVEEPDAKGRHALVIHVDFTAGIALGVGYDKKSDPKARSKGGVTARLKGAASMDFKRHLDEAGARAYLASLEAAAKGDKAAATDHELTIIATGASEGWTIAQQMFAGRKIASAVGGAEGDSLALADEVEGSVDARANLKAVKLEAGTRRGSKSSTTLTRTASGGLDVETNREDSEGASVGGGVDTGLTGMMVRGGYEMKTSIGFLVTIEAADDPTGELLATFRACRTPAQQKAFIDRNRARVTLKEMTQGSEESTSRSVELSAGPADLSLSSKGGVGRTTKTGADGALIDSELVGSQEVGGSAGVGDFLRASDSVKDKATSKHDAQGNVSLDMQRERTSSNFMARVKDALGFGDEPEKKTGLLEDVAGGEKADTDDRAVHGVRLGKDDIRRIVEQARDSQRWSHLAWGVGDTKAVVQWGDLGRSIASVGAGKPDFVADELAAFVGADKGRRMDVLMRLARPGGDVSVGRRSEFPKSLKSHAKAYDELVLRGCVAQVEAKAKKEGPEAAAAYGGQQLQRLEAILLAVRLAEDFSQGAAQAEMMAALNESKHDLLAAMRRISGANTAKDEDDTVRHDFQRLVFQLEKYPEVAEKILARLRKSIGRSDRFYNDDLQVGVDGVTELADVYAIWQREFDKVAAAAKKLGKAEAEYIKLRPDLAEYKRFRKASQMSD